MRILLALSHEPVSEVSVELHSFVGVAEVVKLTHRRYSLFRMNHRAKNGQVYSLKHRYKLLAGQVDISGDDLDHGFKVGVGLELLDWHSVVVLVEENVGGLKVGLVEVVVFDVGEEARGPDVRNGEG